MAGIRLDVNLQVHLQQLTTIVSAMLLLFPPAHAEHLDPSNIDQQMWRMLLDTMKNSNSERLLTPLYRVVAKNQPFQF